MGMFSEVAAESEAKRLGSVLIAAKEGGHPDIITFCKEQIYPLYESAIGEAFCKSDPEITNFYGMLVTNEQTTK